MESEKAPDLRVNIWVGIAIPWIAGLISLGLRVWARRMTKVSWWFDDYFAVLAFVFATGYTGIMVEWTLNTYFGVYLPTDLSDAAREAILTQSRKLSFFNSLCYAASIACSKIAILCLYWRLFKTSSIKIPILLLLGIVVVWIIIRTFMLTFRCLPVASLWDYTIEDKVCNINSDQFFLGTITTHFILDVIILALPLIEVFQLRMRLGQKLAVAGLFLLGTIVCVASGFVLAILVTPSEHADQPTYDYAMFCVWGSVEVNIAIVSACFPLLRPVFAYIFPKGALSSYAKDSYAISGGNNYGRSWNSQPFSRSRKGVKIGSVLRSRQTTADDVDDSSSTHQLADLKHGKSIDSINKGHDGVHTVISSEGPGQNTYEPNTSGIMVSSDTTVRVHDSRV